MQTIRCWSRHPRTHCGDARGSVPARQTHTNTHFACVQHPDLWGSFCVVFQLDCTTQEALICQQKIAVAHTEPPAPLPELPDTIHVRGQVSSKTKRRATAMRAAPKTLKHAEEDHSTPSLPRKCSEVKGFGPVSSSYIFFSTLNV